MNAQPTDKLDKSRLEQLEQDIEKVRRREEIERRQATEDDFAFATPEAYQGEQLEHAEEQHREEDEPDPMEQPTTTREGNVAHAILEDDEDDRSETEREFERVANRSDS